MQTVTVNKDTLIEVMTKNREQHRDAFEEAFDGYHKECIRVLEENLAQFRAGTRKRLEWRESPPEDHTKDYDRVLKMLAMSVDDEIDLLSNEFECYVQDDWGWKQAWGTSNSKYMT